MARLCDYVSFNSDFRDSVNLYLDLNKTEKINSYIPTKSSVDILSQYLETVEQNKNHSTLLIGPYGKGKSHLLLLILAILSLERSKENNKLIENLSERVANVNESAAEEINRIWKNKGRFLPVLIMSTQGDLNQAFMVGLNEALKREGLTELTPETYYTFAVATIDRWNMEYPETYGKYIELLRKYKISAANMRSALVNCEADKLDVFKTIYPELTSGGIFNPLVNSEVLPMYKNIADKLVEDYGYSGIYIVFDEFSKYIEGQDKQAAGNNMKLLQDVCELANSSKQTQVHITMVAHKGIKEYGKYLSVETINSFTGIEGRLKEILFVTSSKNNFELVQNAIYKTEGYDAERYIRRHTNAEKADEFYGVVAFSSTFTRNDFEEIVLKGCYPLSPTSAYLLLNVSEKVAQNERTLFTFISKDEQHSMAEYVKSLKDESGKDWIISADLIYDYFKGLFKKDVNNEYVHNEWLNAEYALSKVSDASQIKLIKALAIINIVNKQEELPADNLCLRLASGVPDAERTIGELEKIDLIYKKKANNCYVFKTRATSKLKTEIKKRKDVRGSRTNIGKVLSEISDVQYILPKRYNDNYTMTRYFRYEYMAVEEFLDIEDLSVLLRDGSFCDGKVIALYSTATKNYEPEIEKKLHDAGCPKLIVLYKADKLDLVGQIQEYEILQELKSDVSYFATEENKVLEKEIPIIEDDLEQEITNYIENTFGNDSGKKIFFFTGGQLQISSTEHLSDVADLICGEVYCSSISINNELINKENIKTSPIKKVRKTIIETLLNEDDTERFLNGTSAEASIYRALFVGTGIRDGNFAPNVGSVLQFIDDFIMQACDRKKCIAELVEHLTTEPIGMRRGVIPIYLTYSLCCRKEDIVIYFGKKELQLSADIILNMCDEPEEYYLFISSEDVKKEAYLTELSELFATSNTAAKTDSRINNVLMGMQRWFRSLPQVTKNIRGQNEYWNNEVLCQTFPKVKSLLQSVEANPYEVLFIEFPKILETGDDYATLSNLIKELKNKLNGYYTWITQRAIDRTILVFDRRAKQDLHHTLQDWYEQQSNLAKHGLHSSRVTGFMTTIEENTSFDDGEIVKKVVRAVTEIHLDTWNSTSLDQYISALKEVKEEIESMDDNVSDSGKLELAFTGKNGEPVVRYYEHVDEGTGAILRNILSDTLEDFSDLSVNDKIAILLEMIEKELS